MEAENSKQAAEIQTLNVYREPESPSSVDHNASDLDYSVVSALRLKDDMVKRYKEHRKCRSHGKQRPRFRHVPYCDNPSSPYSVKDSRNEKYVSFYLKTYIKQRKMTKIQEEVYHSMHSENPFKEKAYKEKAASLKTIVQRLKHMCLAKSPEVRQNKLPEEITKLFSNIEI